MRLYLLRRCFDEAWSIQFRPLTHTENDLSNPTLDKIAHELQLMNTNMADANDIATMAAFPTMPADLDEESRQALKQLRKNVMKRAAIRAGNQAS